uniref:Uncharacterized protein n=1 Tax=viral metagenome TaxID=1070528 RepID=A0A6M3LX61_9ZZZZ
MIDLISRAEALRVLEELSERLAMEGRRARSEELDFDKRDRLFAESDGVDAAIEQIRALPAVHAVRMDSPRNKYIDDWYKDGKLE